MEILKQALTWHDGKEPSERGDKIIIYKVENESCITDYDAPLDGKFAGCVIIAWAYINIGEIKTAIANMNVDSSWLEFLHKNAIKK